MTPPIHPCVVDTNVPLTANGGEDPGCTSASATAIALLMKSGQLVIDDKFRILKEYMNKLSPSGQPGVGDAFLKWVLTNQANSNRCVRVSITSKPEDASSRPLQRNRLMAGGATP